MDPHPHQWRASVRQMLLLLALVATGPLQTGCYDYRVVSARPDPATDYTHRTRHAFFWGLLQQDAVATDCVSNALDEVRVSTNAGYLVVSVLTLGVWVPLDVQWKCAKRPTQEGEI